MRWEGCEWTGCSIGDGEEIKRDKYGGPPTFLPTCKPAGGGREEVNNLAGGAWRGLEECWGFGVNFYQKTFMKMIKFQSLVCCGLAGLSDVPVFSRVEREEMSSMKVKVLSF